MEPIRGHSMIVGTPGQQYVLIQRVSEVQQAGRFDNTGG
jgi:hypothetical protein